MCSHAYIMSTHTHTHTNIRCVYISTMTTDPPERFDVDHSKFWWVAVLVVTSNFILQSIVDWIIRTLVPHISYHLQQHPYARKPNALLTISYYVAIMYPLVVPLSLCISLASLSLSRSIWPKFASKMKAYCCVCFFDRPFHGLPCFV